MSSQSQVRFVKNLGERRITQIVVRISLARAMFVTVFAAFTAAFCAAFCAASFFTSPVARADGGDTTWNGGGLGELTLTKIWSSLGDELQFCSLESNPCLLEPEDRPWIERVSRLSAPGEIRFKAGAGEAWIFESARITEGTGGAAGTQLPRATFNSSQLYESAGVAKPFATLASFALQAQLYRVGQDLADAQALAARVTRDWSATVKKYTGLDDAKPVTLLTLEARRDSPWSLEVYLEFPTYAIDLTSIFKDALPCRAVAGSVHLDSITFLSNYLRFRASAEAGFRCADDGVAYRGRVLFSSEDRAQFRVAMTAIVADER